MDRPWVQVRAHDVQDQWWIEPNPAHEFFLCHWAIFSATHIVFGPAKGSVLSEVEEIDLFNPNWLKNLESRMKSQWCIGEDS